MRHHASGATPETFSWVVTGDPDVALPQLRSFGTVEVVEPAAP